jgi:hypothetical protein
MKTLIILSAFLLVLSSCNKECPVPDDGSGSDPVYTTDPDPDPDPVPPPDDPGDDDNPSGCSTNHAGSTIHWMKATSPHPAS